MLAVSKSEPAKRNCIKHFHFYSSSFTLFLFSQSRIFLFLFCFPFGQFVWEVNAVIVQPGPATCDVAVPIQHILLIYLFFESKRKAFRAEASGNAVPHMIYIAA